MPRRDKRKSKVEGLYKQCKHLLWERCDCPWWGRYKRERVSLRKWAGRQIANKEVAKAVLNRMIASVDAGTFSKKGERPVINLSGTTFGDLLTDYTRLHVEGDSLTSNSTQAYIEMFRTAFGDQSLEKLERSPHLLEDWLRETAKERSWSNANYNRYLEHGRAMFNWALRRKLARTNPFLELASKPESNNRERRITPQQEAQLLECCSLLDRAPDTGRKLSRQSVDEVKVRVGAGELQKAVALSLGISPSVVSNIINGVIWNPLRDRSSVGKEMHRRLIAALDLGLRAGEMLRVQVKYVDYNSWVIQLPADVTKAGKDQVVYAGTERIRKVLEGRRTMGLEAYIFGREDGSFVGSFSKAWKKLFRLAALKVGRNDGYVWHDLRHEYGSSLIEQGATIQEAKEMMRHGDIRTTQRYLKADEARLHEIASKLGARRA